MGNRFTTSSFATSGFSAMELFAPGVRPDIGNVLRLIYSTQRFI